MNFETLSFTIISTILLLSKEIQSSKKYETPDTTPINNRFADLLDSLVKVNAERIEALKKLFGLYDDIAPKHQLRSNQDEEDSSSEEVIVFHNRNEYPEIDKPVDIVHHNRKLCFCQHENAGSDKAIYDSFENRAVNRENPSSEESSTDADRVAFLVTDRQFSDEGKPTVETSSDNVSSNPLTPTEVRSSRHCIRPRHGYKDCKSACKEAYRRACMEYKYGCIPELYRQFRRQCRKTCRQRFKEPYEDDDDYY